MRFSRTTITTCILFLTAACSADSTPDQPGELILQRTGQIGASDGSDAEFQSVQTVVIGPGGNVFAYDYSAQQIREFTADGSFVRTIGRKGSGPGEFQNVHHIGFLGDTLWTIDVDQSRLTLFPSDASQLLTFKVSYEPAVEGLLTSTAFSALRNGMLVAKGDPFPPRVQEKTEILSQIVLMNRNGEVIDTITSIGITFGPRIVLSYPPARVGGPRSAAMFPQMFLRQSFVASRQNGDGIVIVEAPEPPDFGAAEINVRTYDSKGKLESSQSYSYAPMEPNAQMLDSIIAARTQRAEPGAENELRRLLITSRFLPAVTGVKVGVDGSVWIQREDHSGDQRRWTVIDPSGKLAGDTFLPRARRVLYADMKQVLVNDSDEDGIPRLARYEFSKAAK